jgi:hypothetical protein
MIADKENALILKELRVEPLHHFLREDDLS